MIAYPAIAHRLRKAAQRKHPCLSLFAFDLDALVAQVRETAFAGRYSEVAWLIVDDRPLACIVTDAKLMYFHSLMNHSMPPRFVMEHIVTHELIHLEVPPVEQEDGTFKIHPPAFWEVERSLSAQRGEAMAWVWHHWSDCLKQSRKFQGILVKRNWHEYYGLDASNRLKRLFRGYEF